jgi:predicted dehydrogenase
VDSVERGFTHFLRNYRQKKWAKTLLLVKGIHSIDLINDFVGAEPVRVYADGGLDYFGQDEKARDTYCRDCDRKHTCPDSAYLISSWGGDFFAKGDHARDHCVYDAAADVHDNSIVIINYDNGVRISYNEIHFAPEYKREYHFVGTDGRASLVLDQTRRKGEGVEIETEGEVVMLTITKRNEVPRQIEMSLPEGSHWGGDLLMRDALVEAALSGGSIRPNAHDGRAAVAIGCAAEESIDTGKAISIPALVSE